MADPLGSVRRQVNTVYTAAVYFNSVVTLSVGGDPIAFIGGKLHNFINCFVGAEAYDADAAIGQACPYEARRGALQELARLVGTRGAVTLLPDQTIPRRLRGWTKRLRTAFTNLEQRTPLSEAEVTAINAVFAIPGIVTPQFPDIRTANFRGVQTMLVEDLIQLQIDCLHDPAFNAFYNASGIPQATTAALAEYKAEEYGIRMSALWKEITLACMTFQAVTQIRLLNDISWIPLLAHYANHYISTWMERFLGLWGKLVRRGLITDVATGASRVYRATQCFMIYRIIVEGTNPDLAGFWDAQRQAPITPEDVRHLEGITAIYEAYRTAPANSIEFIRGVIAYDGALFPNNADHRFSKYLLHIGYATRGRDLLEKEALIEGLSWEVYTHYNCPRRFVTECAQLQTSRPYKDGTVPLNYLNTICEKLNACIYLYNEAIWTSDDGGYTWSQNGVDQVQRAVANGAAILDELDAFDTQIRGGYMDLFMYAENLIRFMTHYFIHARVDEPIMQMETPDTLLYRAIFNGSGAERCFTDTVTAYESLYAGDYDVTHGLVLTNMSDATRAAFGIRPRESLRRRDTEGGGDMDIGPAPELRTNTDAAERQRVNAMTNFRHEDVYNGRRIMRFFKERPPEQLATAMLGTACTGPNRAAGCYEITAPHQITMPDGTTAVVQTNLPCTDPAAAVKGLCNFKTIPVPWENPVGNSEIYKVYRALDVGAQIKLQLQRALIRYGYAAATLPVYCEKALDRHFSALTNIMGDGADMFGVDNIPLAVDLARSPIIDWPGDVHVESTNQTVAGLQTRANEQHAQIRDFYSSMSSSSRLVDEMTENYLRRNICPHYSRMLPRSGVRIPADLQEAFRKDVPAPNVADATERRNTFYLTTAPVAAGQANPNFLVPYPIYYVIPGTVNTIANRAYLNEKYIGQDAAGKRQLMINRASGMLLRSMQHLRNAMVLYVLAATNPMTSRFTPEEVDRHLRPQRLPDLAAISNVIGGVQVPKGAMAFLTEADKNAMIALFRALLAAFQDDARVSMVYDQMTEADHMRNPDGTVAFGTPYKSVPPLGAIDGFPKLNAYKRVAYLEVLWSYWYDNNSMGKLRKRMNFRAKLANPTAAITEAANAMRRVSEISREYVTADILDPTRYGWAPAALQGLTIAHLHAISQPPPPVARP